jgi:hypothetical protein
VQDHSNNTRTRLINGHTDKHSDTYTQTHGQPNAGQLDAGVSSDNRIVVALVAVECPECDRVITHS